MRKLLNDHRYFLLLLVLLHLIYFICAILFGRIFTNDSDEYLQTAINLVEHGTYYTYFLDQPYQPIFESLRPPLYGIFLILKYIIQSNYFILFLQNLMSISIFIGLLKLFRDSEVKYSTVHILIAAIAMPTHFILTNMIMADLLLQFLLFWSFYCLFYYLISKKVKYIWLYNLLLLLALLTKPILLYFWVINIPFSIWLFLNNKKPAIIIAALLLPIGAFAWSYYNYTTTGYFHYSSIKTLNMLDMNAEHLLIKKYNYDYADSVTNVVAAEAGEIEDFKERSKFIESAATDIITSDLPTYLYIHLRGMANFFVDPGRVDMVEFFPVEEENISLIQELDKKGFNGFLNYLNKVSIPMLLMMLLGLIINILLLVLFLIFLIRPGNLQIKIWLFLMVAYTAFLAGAFGYARFRMSIWPLMLFTIPFAIEYIFYLKHTYFQKR